MDIDLDERMKYRRRQKMQLARYGRQSLDFWDDKDVNELERWYEALAEIMKEEQGSEVGED